MAEAKRILKRNQWKTFDYGVLSHCVWQGKTYQLPNPARMIGWVEINGIKFFLIEKAIQKTDQGTLREVYLAPSEQVILIWKIRSFDHWMYLGNPENFKNGVIATAIAT